MSSPFLASPISFKPQAPVESPFRAAHQAWDLRLGSSITQAKNWRFAFLVTAALLMVTLLTLLSISKQQKVIPVIVALDKESGEPTVVGPVDQKKYQPGPLEIKYFLSQFVRYVRSVPLDQIVIKQNWLHAYAFLRKEAAGLLNEMTQKDSNSPLNKIGKVLVTVQPISILQIPDTNSYQMRWKETSYTNQGTKLEEYTMLATFIIELEQPKDEQTLQENPLGLFIKSFQWNREL
jgi:type IV secretory pathway TrbF-like protein